MTKLRILFVGASWLGSCARSLKEALGRRENVVCDEVNEDLIIPNNKNIWLRAFKRVAIKLYRHELYQQILTRIAIFRPDVVLVYKGNFINKEFVLELKALNCIVVNVYPDYSPHAYGAFHKSAIGAYDLVISTKPFHPKLWESTYGYDNRCVFVPQGYDPALHLVQEPPANQQLDVVLVATWRSEYGELMKKVGELLDGRDISVGIGGNGWAYHRQDYPQEWVFKGPLQGRSYVEWLRKGRICLAPVMREVIINNEVQPGDVDTTRTYELAAAHCFFIHRRTDFVQQLYDEKNEVPMYETPVELVDKILHFRAREKERKVIAEAAHRRAVPNYSLDERAKEIVRYLNEELK